MNLKNKIILFIVIAILLAIGLLASFLYSQEKYNFFNNFPEKDKLELKAECLEKLDKMNNEQFIEEVNNLTFIKDEELEIINLEILQYLSCELINYRKEFDKHIFNELYKRTTFLIQELKISDYVKEYVLSTDSLGAILNRYDENNNKIGLLSVQYEYVNGIALTPMEKICPNNKITDYFLEICLNSGALLPERRNKLSEEVFNEAERRCNSLCENIIRYSNDWSNFEKDNIEFPWSNDVDLLSVQFLMRSALAFRVGGKELALELCDSISNLDSKEKCKHYVMSLDYINCKDFGFNGTKECELKKYEDCEIFYDQAKNLMCKFYSEEYNK